MIFFTAATNTLSRFYSRANIEMCFLFESSKQFLKAVSSRDNLWQADELFKL